MRCLLLTARPSSATVSVHGSSQGVEKQIRSSLQQKFLVVLVGQRGGKHVYVERVSDTCTASGLLVLLASKDSSSWETVTHPYCKMHVVS